jgi:hypothetical protein
MWVMDYMSTQPFINGQGMIVVGQSGGGWGAISAAGVRWNSSQA